MGRKRGGSHKARWKPKATTKAPRPQKNLLQGDLEERSGLVATRLSLVDVARNTERHRDGDRCRLGDLSLTFVHGGLLEGSLELQNASTHQKHEPSTLSKQHESWRETSHLSPIDASNSHGGQFVEPDELLSDSGDDVVVFQGRVATASHHLAAPNASDLNQATEDMSDRATGSHATINSSQEQPSTTRTRRWQTHRSGQQLPATTNYGQSSQQLEHHRIYAPNEMSLDTSEDEEALEDYIANLLAQDSSNGSDYQQSEELEDGYPPRTYGHTPHLQQPALSALPRTQALAQSFEDGRKNVTASTSSEAEASVASSVDTVGQATHDLQVALDDPAQHEPDAARKMITPQRSGQNGHSRYFTESFAVRTVALRSGKGLNEATLSEEPLEAPGPDLSLEFKGSKRPRTRQSKKNSNIPIAVGLDRAERNEFDITDRSRASIGDKNRFGSPHFSLDLSDSELEYTLLESWKKDKAKKRLRKREREEARARGLIGARHNNSSTDSSQLQGLGWNTLTAQIRTFLLSNSESLTLAPMDKRSRRVVHEFANAFNLKSKSVGSGEKRFPTLTRTPRTVRVTEGLFDGVEARLAHRFTTGTKRQFRDTPTGKEPRYGKSSFAAASYKDGEVVGAAAPEIGLDNRGRAMLEKMGWSSGTALGAANNKGILLPVVHTVKNSKLGLG